VLKNLYRCVLATVSEELVHTCT